MRTLHWQGARGGIARRPRYYVAISNIHATVPLDAIWAHGPSKRVSSLTKWGVVDSMARRGGERRDDASNVPDVMGPDPMEIRRCCRDAQSMDIECQWRNQAMKSKLLGLASTYLLLLFLSPVVLGSNAGQTERDAVEVPPNAHLDRSGQGWECDWGYRKSGDTCVAIEVPPNAYLDSYGRRWQCDRGYQKSGEACTVVELPANAHLDSRGHGWECDRGYRKIVASCVAVKVPPNAYLESSGRDWKCNRGYRKIGDSCVTVEVPANAHLDSFGRGWECDPGYRRSGDNCVSSER